MSYRVVSPSTLASTIRDRLQSIEDQFGIPEEACRDIVLKFYTDQQCYDYLMENTIPEYITNHHNDECLICLAQPEEADHITKLECGHWYCTNCLQNYIRDQCMSKTLGWLAGCVGCFQLIKLTHFNLIRNMDSQLVRAACFTNRKIKKCLYTNCHFECQNLIWANTSAKRVICSCGYSFCFECYDTDIGDHTPVSCDQAKKWVETEVNSTILKRCPNCKLIGDNPENTCSIMVCDSKYGGCGVEFCWKCLVLTNNHICPICDDQYFTDNHFTVEQVLVNKGIRSTETANLFGDDEIREFNLMNAYKSKGNEYRRMMTGSQNITIFVAYNYLYWLCAYTYYNMKSGIPLHNYEQEQILELIEQLKAEKRISAINDLRHLLYKMIGR